MKGEKWFHEKATIDLAYLLDQDGAYVVEEMVGFLLSIYDQGRADQNETDVLAVSKLPYELVGDVGDDVRQDTQAAIRAAGPEDK